MAQIRLIRIFRENRYCDKDISVNYNCYLYTNSRYEHYQLLNLLRSDLEDIIYNIDSTYNISSSIPNFYRTAKDRKKRLVWFDDTLDLREQIDLYYYDHDSAIKKERLQHYIRLSIMEDYMKFFISRFEQILKNLELKAVDREIDGIITDFYDYFGFEE